MTVRGEADYASVAPWMVQGAADLETEAPRSMPSWLAPAGGPPVSALPPYGDRPFGSSVAPAHRPVTNVTPLGTRALSHAPAHAAHAAHAHAHAAPPGPAGEPSMAPPPSVNWGTMAALPSLRPMVSMRPTHAPAGDAAEVVALRASLDAALAASSKARQEILESSERDLVDLALVVAARVVGRELRTDPNLIAGWVREGVAGLVAEDDVTVTVSPDVAEALGAGAGVGYRLVVDVTLAPLSCVVRGRYGKVDVGAETRLRLLAEALGSAEAP